MNDDEFNRQLSAWEVDLPEDPHFRSAVWREIAMREAKNPGNRFLELFGWISAPRYAVLTGVIALIATAGLATVHGLQSREQTWDNLATAYSQAIDPVSHSAILNEDEAQR